MAERTWTCQRVSKGVRCGHKNPRRKQKCVSCGKPRPRRQRPKHMQALELSYEQYIELNGGEEVCWICGRGPGTIRLSRDHDHTKERAPRGLLCVSCNRNLPTWVTPEWLERAAEYLRTAPDRRANYRLRNVIREVQERT